MKHCIALLLALCFFASPVLADGSAAKKPKSAVSASKEKPKQKKSDDEVLSLIGEITHEVVRADSRLEVVETRLTDLDTRVTSIEQRQEATIVELQGLKENQTRQLTEAEQLRTELAASNARGDGLVAETQQLRGEVSMVRQQSAQALAGARASDNAARPKGLIGKGLAAIFPRMLGHR